MNTPVFLLLCSLLIVICVVEEKMGSLAKFLTLWAIFSAALGFAGCSSPTSSGTPKAVGWTAEADGAADTVTSTVIVITFDSAVSGLTAEQIAVADGTGSVTAGSLGGGGKSWSLAIDVAAAGDVKLRINAGGIEAAEKTVTVHRKIPAESPATGSLNVSIGFAYGAIAITGNEGANIIKRSGSPGSLVLSVTGFEDILWYIDGRTTGRADNPLVLNAADYALQSHSVTFTGKKDGAPWSRMLAFTVSR